MASGRSSFRLLDQNVLGPAYAKVMTPDAVVLVAGLSDWIKVLFAQFNGNTLHNLFQREHDSEAALLPHHDAAHSRKGTRTDANLLSDSHQGMRLNLARHQPSPQRVDRVVGQRRGFAPRAPDNRHRAGHAQNTRTLRSPDANKDISGKQWQVEFNLGAVAPFALRPVEGKVEFDVAMAEVLGYPLFVTASGIDRKPTQWSRRIRRNFEPRFELMC